MGRKLQVSQANRVATSVAANGRANGRALKPKTHQTQPARHLPFLQLFVDRDDAMNEDGSWGVCSLSVVAPPALSDVEVSAGWCRELFIGDRGECARVIQL